MHAQESASRHSRFSTSCHDQRNRARKIFNDDKDRENLVERLSILVPETKTQCYAWAFLPNHAHFLLRSGPQGIAGLMRKLLTGYAVFYNRRHRRHGQLFQTDTNRSYARKIAICRNWCGIFI